MNSIYDYVSVLYNRISQLENDLSILKEKSLFHKMFCPKCYRTIPIKDGHIPIITCENCDKDKVEDKETCVWDCSIGISVNREGNLNTKIYNEIIYDTDCGIKHIQRDILNQDYKFCPYCGKEIEEIK